MGETARARPARAAVARRVAEHAAAGLSNREIAETLFVTRTTVELHLGRAYGKLGSRSRTQRPAALGQGDGDSAAAPVDDDA